MNIKVNDVIKFLREAKNHTYSSEDKYHLENAIDTLYHMKDCRCFKEE